MHHRGAVSAVAIVALLAAVGCGTAPPEPPGDDLGAPQVLALPQSFGIASSAESLQSPPTASPGNIDYAMAIAEGAGIAAESEELLSFLLNPFQTLSIPVASTVTTFKSTLVITNGSGTKSVSLAAAVDFADFDLDGDGQSEGCSGHTAALPICLRIWLDGERFLAARLDAFPSASSPGAGRLTVRKTTGMPGGEDGMGVTVIFDHQDPTNRRSEMFWGIPSEGPDGPAIVAVRHILLTQTGDPAAALRTVNLSDQLAVAGTNTLRYLVRYRADRELWSGFVDAQGMFVSMLGLQSFPSVCVELASGSKVDDERCQAIGIHTAGLTSIPLAAASSVALPSDFPEQPGF